MILLLFLLLFCSGVKSFSKITQCDSSPLCRCVVNEKGLIQRAICGSINGYLPRLPKTPYVLPLVSFAYADLSHLPAYAFDGDKVQSLDLQGNSFEIGLNILAFQTKTTNFLQTLNLEWCKIRQLRHQIFKGLYNLKNLSLSDNSLNILPGGLFKDLRNLESLKLSGNPIWIIRPNLFLPLESLIHLDIGYCAIKSIEKDWFKTMKYLKHLDLRGNRIKNIQPFIFDQLSQLEKLYLGHNSFFRLQKRALSNLRNLTVLSVHEGSLALLDVGAMDDLINLKFLDLSDNNIEHIQAGAADVPSIERLNLDGNYLRTLPLDINKMKNLKYLDVSYNRLETFSFCLFKRIKELKFLNLRENPWNCRCKFLYVVDNLRTKVNSLWPKEERHPGKWSFIPGRCEKPPKAKGKFLIDYLHEPNVNCTLENMVSRCFFQV
ncbi:unnamed protein product [Dimorphilus gyrociliatus]|uniref:Uncharacterized protein n=1 Tax=Dimorphilus gyrociliatus TaxID=2664684 RepID=A0A7I8VDC0_9ANNE|nr:unnamed protein product [Dimorphilus gyrociliatus]